ncbi:hypothetical protein ANN_09832 [Periplaneta americana]|uniref:Uncharacterized protein n=1 Tax=Periplaneta americana TaxID=6978 RepID=A0ABQ8TMT7_PERAM|nr:hypothetical protein ANN_09832 [Periplaneta americana]
MVGLWTCLCNTQERNYGHTIIFMQDGATPHVARQVKDLLLETFSSDRIISRQFPHAWPSRSPDLNPCDLWLWEYLKDRIYQGHIRSLPDLNASIQPHVARISPDMLRTTVDHAVLRMQHFKGSIGESDAPTAKSIKKWHDTCLATGSVLKKHGGGRRTSDEMVANVQAAYERSPRKQRVPGRWIVRGGPIAWPPRSTYLTPLDFFLWGYVKDKVYATPVRDLRDLRERIIGAIESIPEDMLQRAWQGIVHRLDIVTVTAGAHVEIW